MPHVTTRDIPSPDGVDAAGHVQLLLQDGLVQGQQDVSVDVLMLEPLLVLRQVHRFEETQDLRVKIMCKRFCCPNNQAIL